jgi:hypothetical protein
MKKGILSFIAAAALSVSIGINDAKAASFEGINIISESQKDSLKQSDSEVARVRVYPNPVQENFLYISLGTEKDASYSARIFNLIGRVVENKILNKGQNSIDLTDFKEGIYFVDIIEDGKTIHSLKIIRQ